jgi:hypothetical protein
MLYVRLVVKRGIKQKEVPDGRNHNFSLQELLQGDLSIYQRYTVSIALAKFISNDAHRDPAQGKMTILPKRRLRMWL